MPNFKGLIKDTAIYGVSSIVGRFLNYLLTPLWTYYMPKAGGDYGVLTNMYAWTALLLVILTFGMETTLFRFANQQDQKPDTVFATAFAWVGILSAVFVGGVMLFLTPISEALHYADHPEYVWIMAGVTVLDVLQALPFCYLRFQHRAIKFVSLKMLVILINVVCNLVFFTLLHKTDVVYVFAINLACSAATTFFFIPDFFHLKWHFDGALLRRMLSYSWPILVLGIAGILNQTADKIFFPLVCSAEDAKAQLAEYGACIKVAMIMALITQTFRYGYEPIVFAKNGSSDNASDKLVYYAEAMKWFIIFTLAAFLAVVAFMDWLQILIGAEYRKGLFVVPIVMAAEIMMGIYFNLSFWYKLIDKTIWGMWFSAAGCIVMTAGNLLFIPEYGYVACAWSGFAGYAVCMLTSYIVGQRLNPIPYDLKTIGGYTLLAGAMFAGMELVPWTGIVGILVKATLLCIYLIPVLLTLRRFLVKKVK